MLYADGLVNIFEINYFSYKILEGGLDIFGEIMGRYLRHFFVA